MKNYKRKDFTIEEDYAISGTCSECGEFTEDRDALEDECCPSCGAELIMDTCHEDLECEICGRAFDMWEDVYSNSQGTRICEDCYNNLED